LSPRIILVYNPWAREARTYADLIRRPRGGFVIRLASTPREAEGLIADAEVLYGWNVPGALLARARRLRWIQWMGAGVERLLVPELPPGVVVTRAAGIFGPWMAEYTLGWCLWVTQRMDTIRRQQQGRVWKYVHPGRLRDSTLCVVGLGDIGRHIARAARAFGMRVVGVARTGRPVSSVERVYRPPALGKALGRADFAVVTVPLTPRTRGLIGARELACMKAGAWLLNIARGPVVDERALVAALRGRRLGGAVLDVFDEEPLPPGHPLWGLDNAVITPHVSGPSTPEEIAPIFNANLRRYAGGRRLLHVVDRRRGY
jgi:glyoxylate/hydroxypyruvate reductase A